MVTPTDFTYDEQKMCNYMKDYVESYGYHFLDMNAYREEIGIDFSTDFYDGGGHTNSLGSGKCTAFLEEYLIETFDLPDKRGQSAYASWDKAYAEWQEKAGQAKKVIAEKIETGNYDGEAGE